MEAAFEQREEIVMVPGRKVTLADLEAAADALRAQLEPLRAQLEYGDALIAEVERRVKAQRKRRQSIRLAVAEGGS